MKSKDFTNNPSESAIQKIFDDRRYYIKEATETADLNAIIKIAEIKHMIALCNISYHDIYKITFKDHITTAPSQYVRDDYDAVNQVRVEIDDMNEASDFLTGCKFFIKASSNYTLIADNGVYTFILNKDRINEEELYVD